MILIPDLIDLLGLLGTLTIFTLMNASSRWEPLGCYTSLYKCERSSQSRLHATDNVLLLLTHDFSWNFCLTQQNHLTYCHHIVLYIHTIYYTQCTLSMAKTIYTTIIHLTRLKQLKIIHRIK